MTEDQPAPEPNQDQLSTQEMLRLAEKNNPHDPLTHTTLTRAHRGDESTEALPSIDEQANQLANYARNNPAEATKMLEEFIESSESDDDQITDKFRIIVFKKLHDIIDPHLPITPEETQNFDLSAIKSGKLSAETFQFFVKAPELISQSRSDETISQYRESGNYEEILDKPLSDDTQLLQRHLQQKIAGLYNSYISKKISIG